MAWPGMAWHTVCKIPFDCLCLKFFELACNSIYQKHNVLREVFVYADLLKMRCSPSGKAVRAEIPLKEGQQMQAASHPGKIKVAPQERQNYLEP